jgi:hypothetical protein
VRVEKSVPVVFSISGETFDVGLDSGAAVGDYPHVYRFTGTIHGVTLERLSDPSPEVQALIEDAEFRASLAVPSLQASVTRTETWMSLDS